jgi:hypothetical protein
MGFGTGFSFISSTSALAYYYILTAVTVVVTFSGYFENHKACGENQMCLTFLFKFSVRKISLINGMLRALLLICLMKRMCIYPPLSYFK